MKPVRLLRRLTAALAVAVAGAAWAQQGVPESPPRGGAHGGIGIQVDLGALWRAIASRRPAGQEDAYVPGQIVGVWSADEPLDPEAIARAVGGRLLGSQRLDALALVLVVLEVPEDQIDAALQRLRSRYPAAVFDRHVIYTAAEGPHEASRQPLRYGARLIKAPEVPPRLTAPVRIGIVDGAPDPAVGLEAESIALLPLVEAPAGVERVMPKVRGFVAAGGNGGPEGSAPFPATHPSVIAVAAVEEIDMTVVE